MENFWKEFALRLFGWTLPLAGTMVAGKWGAEYGAPFGLVAAWLLSQAEKGVLPRRKRMFPQDKEKTDPGIKHG